MSTCLFCDIIAGQIPCSKVHTDEDFLAFADIEPQAPTHILVIPRRHIASLAELQVEDAHLLGRLIITAKTIAADAGLAERGYRFVINCGQQGGQTVDHLHLHILGGRDLTWPPG